MRLHWNFRNTTLDSHCLAFVGLIALCVPVMGAGLPVRDALTPATQAGATLVAISRCDAMGQATFPLPSNVAFLSAPTARGFPGGWTLWVDAQPQMSASAPRSPVGVYDASSAVASTGDIVAVQTQQAFTGGYGGNQRSLYSLSIPGGVPPGVAWIDVTFRTPSGGFARWRVVNLPLAFHLSMPPITTAKVKDAVISGRAWAQESSPFGYGNATDMAMQRGIQFHIDAAAKDPQDSFIWQIHSQDLEWSALSPAEIAQAAAGRTFKTPRGTVSIPNYVNAVMIPSHAQPMSFGAQLVVTPYVRENHFIHLAGTLQENNNAIEHVTLRSLHIISTAASMPGQGYYLVRDAKGSFVKKVLPQQYAYSVVGQPQTITTPNGLKLSVLSASSARQDNRFGYFGSNSLALYLRVGPSSQSNSAQSPFGGYGSDMQVSLPNSVYGKLYHKPVSVRITPDTPYYGGPAQPIYAPTGPSNIMVMNLNIAQQAPRIDPHNHKYLPYTPPAMPKFIDSLNLTIDEFGHIWSAPLSLTLQVGPAPARPAPFNRRPMMPFQRGPIHGPYANHAMPHPLFPTPTGH